jgi:hypothetical protein
MVDDGLLEAVLLHRDGYLLSCQTKTWILLLKRGRGESQQLLYIKHIITVCDSQSTE